MSGSAIEIPEDLMTQLEELSAQEGRPIIDIVCDAIRLYLERHHPDLLNQALDTASNALNDEL